MLSALSFLCVVAKGRCLHQPKSVQYHKNLLSYGSVKGVFEEQIRLGNYGKNVQWTLIYFKQLRSLQFLQLCSSALHLNHQSYLENILTRQPNHLYISFFFASGDMLDGSSWMDALSSSSVLTPGKANTMLHASSNVVLCRYVYQVTACSLHISKKQTYQQYVNTCVPRSVLTQELWKRENETHPMFRFWNHILYPELVLLEFVRSIRSGKFGLYIDSLKLIVPCMFSLDHHNYTRLLPVHISEMDRLHKNHCRKRTTNFKNWLGPQS